MHAISEIFSQLGFPEALVFKASCVLCCFFFWGGGTVLAQAADGGKSLIGQKVVVCGWVGALHRVVTRAEQGGPRADRCKWSHKGPL